MWNFINCSVYRSVAVAVVVVVVVVVGVVGDVGRGRRTISFRRVSLGSHVPRVSVEE